MEQATASRRLQLGAVIRDDYAWLAKSFDDRGKLPCDAPAGDRHIRDGAEALPPHIIDDIENSQPTPTAELVVHEIHRPASVGARFACRLTQRASHVDTSLRLWSLFIPPPEHTRSTSSSILSKPRIQPEVP